MGFWRRLFAPRTIFSAIDRADIEQCRKFLSEDRSAVALTDDLGRTPLHVAAQKGHNDIVALLLSAGADHRARDAEGATVLHWAAVGGDRQVVEQLLFAGADVNAVDNHSLTPSEVARMRGHPAIASLLGRPGGKE